MTKKERIQKIKNILVAAGWDPGWADSIDHTLRVTKNIPCTGTTMNVPLIVYSELKIPRL